MRGRLLRLLPTAVCCLLGWAVWHVFRPGLIGSDGMWQLHQAWLGSFHDWFPPAMAAGLRQILLLTGSVGTATLIQAVLGCLGVYHLARAGLRFLHPGLLAPGREAAVGLGVLAVLLVPLSPLAYFLVYVQNDGWLLVALVWAVAGWLNLGAARECGPLAPRADVRTTARGPRSRPAWWLAAVLGSAGVVLARHNAVVLVPLFAALAALSAAHRGRLAAAAAAVLVAGLPFAVEKAVVARYGVEHLHPEDQVLAAELVGVCAARDDLRAELPYTDAHLLPGFREKYIPGFVNPMYLYSPAEARPTDVNFVGEVVNGEQRLGTRHAELVADYRRAVRLAPLTVAAVKWEAFRVYLVHDHRGEHWHPTGIMDNTLGLKPNPGFAGVRAGLAAVDRAVDGSPPLRFVCTNHLPWVVLNVVAVGVVAAGARRGGRRWRVGLLVLLLPLAYVGTHLLAVAGPFYRYVYPAALLVQVGGLVGLAGVAVRVRRKLRAGVRVKVLAGKASGVT